MIHRRGEVDPRTIDMFRTFIEARAPLVPSGLSRAEIMQLIYALYWRGKIHGVKLCNSCEDPQLREEFIRACSESSRFLLVEILGDDGRDLITGLPMNESQHGGADR